MITLIGSTNAKLPNVSAVKALDVYFGICFVYVFGGLIEFATVIYLETKEKKETAQRKTKASSLNFEDFLVEGANMVLYGERAD